MMMNYVCLYLLPTSKAASWLVTMLMNSQKPFYNYKDYFETMLAEEDDLEKVNTARNLMFGEIPEPFTEPDAIFDPTFISRFFHSLLSNIVYSDSEIIFHMESYLVILKYTFTILRISISF